MGWVQAQTARKLLSYTKLPMKIFIGCISHFVPKKSGLIIFCSDRYNENSRYCFEYLKNDETVSAFWLSYDQEITLHLKANNFPCLSNLFVQIFFLMRASIVVASGNSFWDRWGAVSKKTIKYCLSHGCAPKITEYYDNFERSVVSMSQINSFDYVNFTSKFTAHLIGKLVYKLPHDKIVINGYPRNDQFFDVQQSLYKERRVQLADALSLEIGDDTLVGFYAPTFRKYDLCYGFPIQQLEGFDPQTLNNFLKENNILIIYTKHPQTKFDFEKQTNFVQVSYESMKLFDINYFLVGVDVLLNDYATTSTDFCITGRPQIFIMPDYDEFQQRDAFLEDYRSIIPGVEVSSLEQLKRELVRIKSNAENPRTEAFLAKYYDTSIRDACLKNAAFLKGFSTQK